MTALATAKELKAHFLGLANPTRLAIMALLGRKEMAASELADRLRLSQPLLSWHLRIMRKAGLIATRRVGREVQIRLDREAIAEYQRRFNKFIEPTNGPSASQPFVGTPTEEIANAI